MSEKHIQGKEYLSHNFFYLSQKSAFLHLLLTQERTGSHFGKEDTNTPLPSDQWFFPSPTGYGIAEAKPPNRKQLFLRPLNQKHFMVSTNCPEYCCFW